MPEPKTKDLEEYVQEESTRNHYSRISYKVTTRFDVEKETSNSARCRETIFDLQSFQTAWHQQLDDQNDYEEFPHQGEDFQEKGGGGRLITNCDNPKG